VCVCCVCGVIHVWECHHHRVIVVRVLTTGVDLFLDDRFESVRKVYYEKVQKQGQDDSFVKGSGHFNKV